MGVAPIHLVRRFVGSLRPGGPPPVDVAWVAATLTVPEFEIWSSMSGPDRRHSVAVAHEVRRRLGPDADAPVLAAALLHDSGKVESHLRTPMRVVATVVGLARGRRRTIDRWSRRSGIRGRIASYLDHPEIGATELEVRGSDPLTVAWTREHHRPEQSVTIDHRIAGALRAADDD